MRHAPRQQPADYTLRANSRKRGFGSRVRPPPRHNRWIALKPEYRRMGISHADAKVGVPMRQQPNAAWAGMPAGSAGGRQTQAAEISHTLQRRRAAQHFIQTLRDTRATFRAEATGELARELELPEHRPQAREVVGMPTTVPTTDPQLCEAIQAVIADEHPPTTGVLRKPSTIARPSWTVVIALLAAVAAVMWAIMFQRLPDFDPREAIAEKLYAARRAFDTGQYLDPSERSAYHHYNAVLAWSQRMSRQETASSGSPTTSSKMPTGRSSRAASRQRYLRLRVCDAWSPTMSACRCSRLNYAMHSGSNCVRLTNLLLTLRH